MLICDKILLVGNYIVMKVKLKQKQKQKRRQKQNQRQKQRQKQKQINIGIRSGFISSTNYFAIGTHFGTKQMMAEKIEFHNGGHEKSCIFRVWGIGALEKNCKYKSSKMLEKWVDWLVIDTLNYLKEGYFSLSLCVYLSPSLFLSLFFSLSLYHSNFLSLCLNFDHFLIYHILPYSIFFILFYYKFAIESSETDYFLNLRSC